MKSTLNAALKISSRNILDEILAQLGKRGEALQGVEATIITKELVYRQGQFVVKAIHKEQRLLGGQQRLDDLIDLGEILASSKYSLAELRGDKHNLIRILVKPARAGKFDLMNPRGENHQAAIVIISKTPVRLLEMKMFLVNLPWWLKWLLKLVESGAEFEYIRGVPVPKKVFSHVQSRGIGSWRLGGGEEIEVQYKELSTLTQQ